MSPQCIPPRNPPSGKRTPAVVSLFMFSLVVAGCSGQSRSTNDVGLEARRALPRVHLPSADAGSSTAASAPAVRALAWGTFGEADRMADLQGLSLKQSTLLAWVTYVDPPPPSRAAHNERRTASVFVRPIDADGEAITTPKLVSSKALSTGGVSLARQKGSEQATLAWTGLDVGKAQVFLTQISVSGDRVSQRMLTHSRSDCSDVALTAAGDGFIVAWLEQQGAAFEIDSARVGSDLVRTGDTRKIAVTGGDASQLRIVANRDDVMLVWNETRPQSEQSGIFGVRLSAIDGSARDDVTQMFPLGRAESVRLAAAGDGWLLAWLEAAPAAQNAPAKRHAAFAELGRGRARTVSRVEVPADLSSLALDCDTRCRVIAAGTHGDAVEFDAWQHDPTARRASSPQAIGTVSGASAEDVSPVLLGDWLFFAQDDLNGKGRVGKSRLFWPSFGLSK